MLYVLVVDNIVTRVVSAPECPAGYAPYPDDMDIYTGCDIRFFDSKGKARGLAAAKRAGLITVGANQAALWDGGRYTVQADYTGRRYWVKATRQEVAFALGETPGNDVTDQEPPTPTAEWVRDKWVIPAAAKADAARSKRNGLLAESDYILMPDHPLRDKAAWKTYRQSLRDVPQQAGFPDTITWPIIPSS